MTGPDAKRPRRCSAEARESAHTLARESGAEHSAESADALIRLGVTLTLSGCDCIAEMAQHLALSAGFCQPKKSARGGA